MNFIGLVGFEPTASWSRTRRSTKLSHSPKWNSHFGVLGRRASYFAYFSADSKEIERPVLPGGGFCCFCSPHGNDKVIYPTAMTRFATLIIAVSFCSNAAAAPLVTFESPCE